MGLRRVGQPAYRAPVRTLWSLLVLVTMLVMPFGMSAAPAMSHSPAAAMPMRECPESGGKAQSRGASQCMMACSASLPAADLVPIEPPILVHVPVEPTAPSALVGLHPDIATPPPKLS
jgi:hypothetical protein